MVSFASQPNLVEEKEAAESPTDAGAPVPEASDESPRKVEPATPRTVADKMNFSDAPATTKTASLKFSISADKADEVYCARFSPDDTFIAVAFGNGTCGINNTVTGRHAFLLSAKKGTELALPMTQVRWRPLPTRSKADLMVSVSSDGIVSLWHVSARKRLHEVVEQGNQLFCVDYAADASTFATAGQQPVVRIYDESQMKVLQTMTGGDVAHGAGHSNRIFAMKYHPIHPNILCTGSWDKKVQFWDTRVGYAVRALYGPLVSGDSMDLSSDGEMILTGSCRRDDQLQLWDFKSAKLISTLPWLKGEDKSNCKLYTAQFSKNKTAAFRSGSLMIAAGGSNPDEMKLFDLQTQKVCHEISLNSGCFSVDFSNDSDMLAVASGDGKVQVLILDHRAARE